jgi:hypothetical protein
LVFYLRLYKSEKKNQIADAYREHDRDGNCTQINEVLFIWFLLKRFELKMFVFIIVLSVGAFHMPREV